jgi:hypothetical protein
VRCGKHEQKLSIIIIIIIIIITTIVVVVVVVGRDSVVGIATRYGLDDRIPVGARFSTPVQTGPGSHPASYTIGTGSLPGFYKQALQILSLSSVSYRSANLSIRYTYMNHKGYVVITVKAA